MLKINTELLDKMVSIFHKQYLSELHEINRSDLLETIKKMDVKNYSLEQWSYTLSYILDRDVKIKKTEDIFKLLF